MKVAPRAVPVTSATPAAAPPAAPAAKKHVAVDLPRHEHVEMQLKGERAQDFKGLAARGGLPGVVEPSAVESLCQRYGTTCTGRPEERFLSALSTVDAALRSEEGLLGRDARREIFHLEALLQLYVGAHPKLNDSLIAVRELERALGAVSVPKDALKVAKDKDAPKLLIHTLKDWRDNRLEALDKLVSKHWFPKDGKSPAVASVLHALAKEKLGDNGEDRAFLKRTLKENVHALKEMKFSSKNLDEGVHALRWRLRFVVLQTEALDGLVQLGPVKDQHSAYAKLVGDPKMEQQLKFRPYPKPREGDQPIAIPAEVYAGMQKAIFDLGVIKDDAEVRQTLTLAAKKADMKAHHVDDVLGGGGRPEEMEKQADAVQHELGREHLLQRLEDAFA